MKGKVIINLFVLLFLVILSTPHLGFPANFVWTQQDWSGGETINPTGHDPAQNGQSQWKQYYSSRNGYGYRDGYIGPPATGGISLFYQPASWTQSASVKDFDTGTLTNLQSIWQGTSVATKYEENDPAVSTTGTWGSASRSGPSGGRYMFSNTTGSSATLTFSGTEVSWIGVKSPSYGIAGIYLDGAFQGNVDQYSSTLQWQQVLWSITGLANTTHTLRIEVTGLKHPSASNTYVGVDAFNVVATPPDEGAYMTINDQIQAWTQSAVVNDFDTGTLTNLQSTWNGTLVVTKYEENDPAVSTTGTWGSASRSEPSGGRYMFSNTTGSSATLTFSGTELSWIGVKSPSYGIAGIYLDGVFQGNVDQYSSTLQWQQVLWSITGLVNTTHTLKIEVTGLKNPSASGTYVGVDAFDVGVPSLDQDAYLTFVDAMRYWTQTSDIGDFDTGILTNLKFIGGLSPVSVRYEENDPAVSTTGTWGSASRSGPSGGRYMFSNTTGSSATLTFSGTEVSWIGVKSPSYGIAGIYLDGAFQGNVDQYSSTLQWQQVLWSITGLANTTHTLRIEVTGLKNPSASGTYVGVDAFDVLVPVPDPGAYLTLDDNAVSGIYESPSLDVGSGGGLFTSIVWNVGCTDCVPSGSSLKFRIATKDDINDGQPWNFEEFPGESGYDYVTPGFTINQGHSGRRYIKYKAIFERPTTDPASNIKLNDVTINYGLLSTLQGIYESPSFDVGFGGGLFTTIEWNPGCIDCVPAGSSLKFRIATKGDINDGQPWNFEEFSGESGYDYINPGAAINPNHNGRRYIRYKAIFERPTIDPADSPTLKEVTINYGFAGGVYESPSFDVGFGGALFTSIEWNVGCTDCVPAGSSLKFRIATKDDINDGQPWNFEEFSGESGYDYVTSSGAAVNPDHSGRRYIKYRAIFDRPAIDPASSPTLKGVTVSYKRYPPVEYLISSPYNSMDDTTVINRWMWDESLPPNDTDIALQLRTAPSQTALGTSWWYGPHATVFSAAQGVSQVTVADTSGFAAGSRVTLTNSADINQEEIKKITAIDTVNKRITLDSNTSYTYSPNSILSDTYTDPSGTEFINPIHRNGYTGGTDDRWIQYRVILFTVNGLVTPTFLASRIGYVPANRVFRPDGVMDITDCSSFYPVLAGDGTYDDTGSGSGGLCTRLIDPGFRLTQPAAFDIVIQNDGTFESIDDIYTVSWNTPLQDATGIWDVYLSDGGVRKTSPFTLPLDAKSEKPYTLVINPPEYATGGTYKDIILKIRSANDYGKVDSIKATTVINSIYQGDGIIDNLFDDVSTVKEAGPGDTVTFSIKLENEGNVSDKYKLSLLKVPPAGWTVLINDGSKDYDITNPSNGWLTPSVPQSLPGSVSSVTYTLKVIPKGAPTQPEVTDIILNIYSDGGKTDIDSLTARVKLKGVYKVDGVIYGYGYENVEIVGDLIGNEDGVCEAGEKCAGEIRDYGVKGAGCDSAGPGDNINATALGVGDGGCAAVDIPAGIARAITVGIQNEGNLPDRYNLSWNIPSVPSGWRVVMHERLNDGSVAEYNGPDVNVPTAAAGNPSQYNSGEVPFFTFSITPPSTFTSGSQTIKFDIKSIESGYTKYDSVKAVVNSGDTTPPASAFLTLSNITATSVKVSWPAPGDDGNSGTAKSYDLRYSIEKKIVDDGGPINEQTEIYFNKAARVSSCKSGESILRQPRSAGNPESCTVPQLFVGKDYYFALKTTDDAGNVSAISTCTPPSCKVTTGSSGDITTPGAISDLNAVYTRVLHPINNPAFTGTTYAVSLKWTAKADDGNITSSGPATAYDLRYSTKKIVEDGVTRGAGELYFSEATPVTVIFRYDSNGIVPVCLDGVTDLAQLDQVFIANQGELLPPKSSGGTECYTVLVENKINTGGNIIDDRTQNTRLYFAVKALDERGRESASNISPISNVAGGMTRLMPYSYNMVSVPYIPNPNTPAAVFGDDVGTPLYVYNWDSRGPNSGSGCYNGEPAPHNLEILGDGAGDEDGICDNGEACYTCSRLTSVKEGLGHFLWVPSGNYTLDVPLSSLPSSSSASYSPNCDDGSGGTFPCYIFTLQDGWNIIGNTFDKDINLSNRDINGNSTIESNERGVYVRKTGGGGGVATFQIAATARNWIDNDIFTYNGVNYTYEICDQDQGVVPVGTKCPIVIQPWKSYWIRVHGGGGATFDLMIPE